MDEEILFAGGERMTTEFLVANKESNAIYEMSNCTTTASWETNRTGSPGKFTASFVGDITIDVGDAVRFSVDGQLQFYGWVFNVSKNRWKETEITCYDRLRYLKASASYAFYDQSAGDIITQIAGDMQLTTGQIEDTGFAIPSLVEEEQTCLDIIGSAVQQTLLNTGRVYIFYDDGDGLALREAANMVSNIVLGEKSLLTEYTDETEIDSQTYNSVKLSRPNEDTGRSDVFIAQDSSTISQWGFLQLYQTVDGDVNDAQVKAQAEATLSYYNRPMRNFSLSALGVPGLRAGMMIYVNLPDIQQFVLLEKVSHTWENDTHTMEIETLTL